MPEQGLKDAKASSLSVAGNLADEKKDATPEQEAKTEEKAVPFLSLYRYADGVDYVSLFVGTVGAIGNGLIFPAFSFVFGELIDALSEEDPMDKVRRVSLWFLYLGLLTLVLQSAEVSFFKWSGARQTYKLRQDYLKAALKQDIPYYDTDMTSGDVLSGINEDCNAVQAAISEKVSTSLHHLVTTLAGIGIALFRGWKLALVMLALMPLIAMSGGILAKSISWGTTKRSEAYSKANTTSSQAITNIRTVQSFQSEPSIFSTYSSLLEYPRQISIRLASYAGAATGSVNMTVFLAYGIAFLYGGKLVRDLEYTAGEVMNVIFAAIIAGFSLGQAAPNFPAFAQGRSAGYRIMQTINRTPKIDVDADGLIPSQTIQGSIELKDVSFHYPARPDVQVFTSLSLSVSPGQTVALVGPSGCGKSTIIQLLERFYDPLSGTVSLDGVDIRKYSLKWYRDQVGLVSQEPTLFATSIRENISMGRPGATEKEIQAAASAANAASFIERLPEGYSTQVGEKGVQLSGGQKQRVAIARALLKNPRVLLLDEATSALDTVSERLVQQALERLATGRTSIVVAHRLSTIRNSDKIAVLQAGNVVEEGTHTDLYARPDSVYHSLVALQEAATDRREEMQAVGLPEEGAAEDIEVVVEATDGSKREFSARGTSSLKRRGNSSVRAPANAADGTPEEEEDLTEEEKQTKVGFFKLLSMNKQEWPFIFVGSIAAAAIGSVMPLFAVILSELVGALQPTEPASRILRFCILFWCLGVGQFICGIIQGYMFGNAGSNLAKRTREMFFQAVLRMEIGWFDLDANTSGALTSRLSNDAPAVRGAVADTVAVVVQNLTTLIMGYVIALTNGWKMTLVITAVLPLLGFSSYMQMKMFTGQTGGKDDALFDQANQVAHESVQALRTVHSYNLQERVVALYHRLLDVPHKQGLRSALISGIFLGLGQAIMMWVYALAFWYGGILVERGEQDLTQTLKVFFAILLAAMGMSQAQVFFPDLAKGQKAVQRVFRVIQRASLIDSTLAEGERPSGEVEGAVELRDVTFAYPTRPDVPVFAHFSLIIPAGKVTALVGESGSGKSTIVNLVERFYDVQEGTVLLDGVDIRRLDITWLRRQVGLVSQEPALFNATILENLKLGKPDASLEEVMAACTVANAREFIEKQPDQYGTLLGEGGGISLSGGQKQRLAIARAVLKDPRVLLLDEATSALDAESERLVQGALEKLMVGRTSIVIAHRLTTVRNADKIAVVQRGVVLEEGSHEELMQKGPSGGYVQLARAQAGM